MSEYEYRVERPNYRTVYARNGKDLDRLINYCLSQSQHVIPIVTVLIVEDVKWNKTCDWADCTNTANLRRVGERLLCSFHTGSEV